MKNRTQVEISKEAEVSSIPQVHLPTEKKTWSYLKRSSARAKSRIAYKDMEAAEWNRLITLFLWEVQLGITEASTLEIKIVRGGFRGWRGARGGRRRLWRDLNRSLLWIREGISFQISLRICRRLLRNRIRCSCKSIRIRLYNYRISLLNCRKIMSCRIKPIITVWWTILICLPHR